MTEQTIGKLAAALSKAQGMIKNATKDAENPAFKRGNTASKYADLASVWDACREALAANEIAVVQQVMGGPDTVTVSTVLAHASGESISCSVTGKPSKPDVQGMGSTITYLRRYSLASMVGVAPEDDDGNASAGVGGTGAKVATKTESAASKAASDQQQAGTKTAAEAKFFVIDGEGNEHGIMTGPLYLKAVMHYFKEATNKAGFWESNEAKFKEYHDQETKVGGKAADKDFAGTRDTIVSLISGASNLAAA